MPDIPGLPFSDRILNPLLRYDFGPGVQRRGSLGGDVASCRRGIVGVLPTYVPRVNAGRQRNVGRPVGAAAGAARHLSRMEHGRARASSPGYGCGFQGGWIPFAKTKAERIGHNDPRLSIEERYGTHEGYVAAVRKAADQAVTDRFLLPDDAARYVREAQASKVLDGGAAGRLGSVSRASNSRRST